MFVARLLDRRHGWLAKWKTPVSNAGGDPGRLFREPMDGTCGDVWIELNPAALFEF
jgi:hypothetical protein